MGAFCAIFCLPCCFGLSFGWQLGAPVVKTAVIDTKQLEAFQRVA